MIHAWTAARSKRKETDGSDYKRVTGMPTTTRASKVVLVPQDQTRPFTHIALLLRHLPFWHSNHQSYTNMEAYYIHLITRSSYLQSSCWTQSQQPRKASHRLHKRNTCYTYIYVYFESWLKESRKSKILFILPKAPITICQVSSGWAGSEVNAESSVTALIFEVDGEFLVGKFGAGFGMKLVFKEWYGLGMDLRDEMIGAAFIFGQGQPKLWPLFQLNRVAIFSHLSWRSRDWSTSNWRMIQHPFSKKC